MMFVVGVGEWWRRRQNDPQVQRLQRINAAIFWRRIVFMCFFLPPMSLFLWWREKGEMTSRDLLGLMVMTLTFWGLGYWLARRKGIFPFNR